MSNPNGAGAPHYGYVPPTPPVPPTQSVPPTPPGQSLPLAPLNTGEPVVQPAPVPQYGWAQPSGRKFWGLLFLFYIPYVGLIVVIIVSLVQRSTAKQSPYPIVRENARWAANWVLSYTFYLFVSFALVLAIGIPTAATSYDGDPSPLIAIPAVLMLGIGIYCLVTMIRGCVVADRVVHRPALALPLFRGERVGLMSPGGQSSPS